MYSCRRFLGLILTGLFVTSLFASSDLLANSPKELNTNERVKSISSDLNTDKSARVLADKKAVETRLLADVKTTEQNNFFTQLNLFNFIFDFIKNRDYF